MRQFIRFVATGGVAALVNIGSRLLLSMAMPFEWAVAVAYMIGMVTAYVLARVFVFRTSGQTTSEFIRFGLVNVVALAQVWLVSVGLEAWLFPAIGFHWNAELVAHVIGVLSPVISSYFLHRGFTFRADTSRTADKHVDSPNT